MMERVFEYVKALADADGSVEIRQTAAAKSLGLASSNINVSIKRLLEAGRLQRVSQRGVIWTYRIT